MKAKKSTLSKIALLLTLSLFSLVGCSQSSGTAKPSTDGKQVKGGIVRTTIGSEPDNLDPHLSAAADTESIMNNVFEGLMGFNSQGEFVPRLATHYTVSEDGLNYTFVIRTDVTFHNGKPVTTEDILYSYKSLAGLSGSEPLSSLFKHVASIEKVDDQTVQFVLTQKDASFLSACTKAVVPADYKEQSTKPIGTGPFLFKEYSPGQKIVLGAYTDYYDKDRLPAIDAVEFRIMTDPNSILMALKSGELDIAQVDYINAATLEGQFNVVSHPQNMVQLLALNNEVVPFNNLKVRQAINYAINKDILIEGLANGYGTKLYTNASPVMGVWYNDLSSKEPYPYNPEKAKAFLKEAGYENGFTTTVKVPSNYQFHIDTAQVLKEQLAEVGITLNIELTEWGQWLDKVYSQADYEATIVGLSGKIEPQEVFQRFESSYKKNFYKFTNAQYDKLVEEASVETDQTKRIAIYHSLQQLLADDAASVFIMDPHFVVASVPTLQGYTAYPAPYFDATTLYYTSDK